MFSLLDTEFMANQMCIDVSSIESKFNEPFFPDFKEIAISVVSQYIKRIKEFESSSPVIKLDTCVDNAAESFIRSHYCQLVETINDQDVMHVFDALRHSFSCYAYNGLHQLYTRQENEAWHPKIWLFEVLEPNDIDTLEPIIKIYRGCDIAEYEKEQFGQAWTTSLNVARDFAYKHYRSQDWFKLSNRVVLETSYLRDELLYSNQSIEYEVVVVTDKLEGVHKHYKQHLTEYKCR